MSKDPKDPWGLPYEVGYKKPPENRRFAKGKSGNPRGRPAKKTPDPKPLVDKSTMESILKMALREVTAREGDNLTKITVLDAVLHKMSAQATNGSVSAQKAIVELVDRARKEQAAGIKADHTFWQIYVDTYKKDAAALQKTGQPLPADLPHPDDLVFEDLPVMIRGGEPLIAAKNRDTMIRLRDVFMLQAEQDVRRYPSKEKYHQRTTVFVSHYLVVHINSCLPKRMQLSDGEIESCLLDVGSLKNRELEQRLKTGWANLGVTYARNCVTQPLKPLLSFLGIALLSENSPYPAGAGRRP